MKKDDFFEWLILLNDAKETGMTEAEIKQFFQVQSKINVKRKIITKSRNKAFEKWYLKN